MNYIAEEKDVKETVVDFIKFCDYIGAANPFATQKGDLSTKACYEVNQLLKYSVKKAKLTDRMYQYPSVSLWFFIAKESGFIDSNDMKGGKAIYNTTETYLDFKKMNMFSQYLLIFNIWFCFVDIEAQYKERGSAYMLGNLIDRVFSQLSDHSCGQWIQQTEYDYRMFDSSPVHAMMEHYYKTAHDLMNLGLLILKEGDVLSKYYRHPVIDRVKTTPIGSFIMKVCRSRQYKWFNVYVETWVNIDESEIYDRTMDAIEDGEESFITPFLSCFPQGSVDVSAINKIVYEYDDPDSDNRILEFKVLLSKKCYRVIRCLPSHTFESLHLAIQKAFDFDNDHLYSFYLDGKKYSNYSVSSPYSERPPYSDEVCLGDIRLKDKQNILYLFDYGDQWIFQITVIVKDGTGINLDNPEIIETVGEAPEQYPDCDEFFN